MKQVWAMTQTWRHVVFLHWPVSPKWLRPFVPGELELDTIEGKAWIGIVPFTAERTRLRFLPPIPGVWKYNELNVRTYVRRAGRSGVFFFSLDADSLLAVQTASMGRFLPYRMAQMKHIEKEGCHLFWSQLKDKTKREAFLVDYKAGEEIPLPSALESWLTERYCLWTKPKNILWRIDIDHTPWRLQHVHLNFAEHSLAPFLPASVFRAKPLAHYSFEKRVRFRVPMVEKRN